jgi:hypothetical protein
MKRILFVALLVLLPCYLAGAGSVGPKILLEVRTSGAGMVAFSGNHLYLRIFDNGQIEYEDIVDKNVFQKFVLRKSKLTPNQLEGIVVLLHDSELRAAKQEYSPDATPIDHRVTLDISIARGSAPQVIKLTNYRPFWAKSKGKYPDKLIDLVCRIDALRGETVFRGVEEGCSLR